MEEADKDYQVFVNSEDVCGGKKRHGLASAGISTLLTEAVTRAAQAAYPMLVITEKHCNVTPGRTSAFQCGAANVIVALLKKMKVASDGGGGVVKNVEVADRVVQLLNTNPSLVWMSEATAARGFINIEVNSRVLAEVVTASVFQSPRLMLPMEERKRVAVDFR